MSLGSEPPRLGSSAGRLPVLRSIEAAAQRTQALSGDSRVAPACAPRRMPTSSKPAWRRCSRTWVSSARQSVPTTKRSWHHAEASGGMALTGLAGSPAPKVSTSRLFQPNTFPRPTGRARPMRVDGGIVRAAAHVQLGRGLRHRQRDGRRTQAGHGDATARVHQRGDGVRQHDGGVGQQPAPVARVVAAFARAQRQLEIHRAARAHEQRGPLGVQARAVAGQEDIGRQLIAPGLAEAARPGEPASSPVSISQTALKPSLPPRWRWPGAARPG